MNQSMNLSTQQALHQTLSAQMIQSLKLLQISALQLEQTIKQELEINPVLEEVLEETQELEEDTESPVEEEDVDEDLPEDGDLKVDEQEIDWEEYLSHFVGDIIAHQVGNCVRSFVDWNQQTAATMRQNMTEYLQEEIRYFPPREECQDFFNDVDEFRSDIDRMEARIQRLKQ